MNATNKFQLLNKEIKERTEQLERLILRKAALENLPSVGGKTTKSFQAWYSHYVFEYGQEEPLAIDAAWAAWNYRHNDHEVTPESLSVPAKQGSPEWREKIRQGAIKRWERERETKREKNQAASERAKNVWAKYTPEQRAARVAKVNESLKKYWERHHLLETIPKKTE